MGGKRRGDGSEKSWGRKGKYQKPNIGKRLGIITEELVEGLKALKEMGTPQED